MNEGSFKKKILKTVEDTVNESADKEQDKIISKLIDSGLEYKEAFSIFKQIKIDAKNKLIENSVEKINKIKNCQ